MRLLAHRITLIIAAAMSTLLPTYVPAVGMPPEPVQPLSVPQYLSLVQSGKITDDSGCELIEGWMVPTMTKAPGHEEAHETLRDLLVAIFPEGWLCRSQGPIVLLDSVPEPDLSIVPGPRSRFRQQHPQASDVEWLVEVSDTTLERDRGSKLRAYARSSIREYWIVNLIDRQIEVYTSPQPNAAVPGYAPPAIYHPGEQLPVHIGGVEAARLSVDEVLGS
jgi:Uma2 family endonuclease